jgi:hypothetical protein
MLMGSWGGGGEGRPERGGGGTYAAVQINFSFPPKGMIVCLLFSCATAESVLREILGSRSSLSVAIY